jgi:hypothetical protein
LQTSALPLGYAADATAEILQISLNVNFCTNSRLERADAFFLRRNLQTQKQLENLHYNSLVYRSNLRFAQREVGELGVLE